MTTMPPMTRLTKTTNREDGHSAGQLHDEPVAALGHPKRVEPGAAQDLGNPR